MYWLNVYFWNICKISVQSPIWDQGKKCKRELKCMKKSLNCVALDTKFCPEKNAKRKEKLHNLMYALCINSKISVHLQVSLFFWLFTGTHSAVSKSRQSQQQHSLFCFFLAVLNCSWHCLTPINAFKDFWAKNVGIPNFHWQN